MKVLLLNPPKHRLMNTDVSYFPLNLGALAGSLEKHDIEVKIHNAELEESSKTDVYPMSFIEASELQSKLEGLDFSSPNFSRVLQEIIGVMNDYQPDILGLTCMSGDYMIAKHIAAKIKEAAPDCVIVMGGSHVSALPEASLDDSIDYILAGQAEDTFVELINLVQNGVTNVDRYKRIKGICLKDGDEIFLNHGRDDVDITQVAMPSRHPLLFHERMKPNTYAHIMASRGCPFSCNFCSVHTVQEFALKYRPVDDVINEIKQLLFDFGSDFLIFHDSIFNVNQTWVKEFCEAIQRDKLEFKWSTNCHVNTLAQREQQLDMMVDAGLDLVVIGLEVDRDELWKQIKKNITEPNIFKLIEMMKGKNVNHTVNMIYGFPFDDEENFKKRNEFLLRLDPQHVAANICQPLPGTELFNEWVAKEKLDVSTINYMTLTTQSTTNNYTDIPYERYLELIDESYRIVDSINKKNQAYDEGFFFSKSKKSNRDQRVSRPVASLNK